jgi:tripartite-type tricarboxylate transporter receptor subunit TctC
MERKRVAGMGWKMYSVFIPLLHVILIWGEAAQAQEYPARPITFIIANAPGGGLDICARILGQEAGKILGQEIVPVNKPGGGGAVGTGILASSKGDGYTVLATTDHPLTTIPFMESLPYDPVKDLIPIIQYGSLKSLNVVRSDSPHKSFKEVIDFARRNPGKVSFGPPGIGVSSHLFMEHVAVAEKLDIAVLPFDGAAPALASLMGGHITMAGSSTTGVMSHYKGGKVRPVVVRTSKRLDWLPDVPTATELGYQYFNVPDLYLLLVPKGTPSEFVKKLEGAFKKAMGTPAFKSAAEKFDSFEENPLSGQGLRERIERLTLQGKEIVPKIMNK